MSNCYDVRFSLLILAICLSTGLVIGCWGSNADPQPQTDAKPAAAPIPSSLNHSSEIVADWQQPAVAIVLTGEQRGYLEPCGCSETQSGGISRRADLFRQLRDEKGWDVVGLDLGDTMKRSRRQDQIKFGVLRTALDEMGYAGMSLGPSDLKLQVDYLFGLLPNAVDETATVPYISANVAFYQEGIGSPAPFRVIETNGVKIGVTGILGAKYNKQVTANAESGLILNDPIESLKTVVPQLQESNCDFLLLLSQAPRDETDAILQAVPEFDVCLTGGGPEDPNGIAVKVGQTLVLETGRKGKYAGVLGYYPEDTDHKFRFELIDLNKSRFERTEAMEAQMAFYQELLEQENIIENEPAVSTSNGYSYVGSETCGKCHTKAYAHWKKTKHSHATETLVHGDPNYAETEWINRVHDPECVACHATGWNPQEVFRYESGFVSLEQTPQLTGQGCENCHGPGSHHTEKENLFLETRMTTPDIQAARDAMKLNLATAEKQVCGKCHDAENSPKFEFTKYWEKVVHRGKD